LAIRTPEAACVLLVFSRFALVFFVPFWWMARYERVALGQAVEDVLRRVAAITTLGPPPISRQ
jgi:hypothetical protein